MKNLFFVSVAFCIFSGTSYKAGAQTKLRFIDNVEVMGEKMVSSYTIAAPEINTTAAPDVLNSGTEMCTSLQFKYAQLTEQEVENIRNKRLYTLIEDWYSTRYRMGGNSRKGIDCSSFAAMLVDAMHNVCLPRTAREQYAQTDRISEKELQEGDLVFFNTRGGVSHVGIYLANGYFVHASSSNGVIISSMTEPYYLNRYVGAGRIVHNLTPVECE